VDHRPQPFRRADNVDAKGLQGAVQIVVSAGDEVLFELGVEIDVVGLLASL
jgi:hypothetical protein